ncbi:hypothetical protein FRB90_006293 [Tulasnella sp. 427]|nr:hypothetical protein FRB90_006293 [Tulasnella sp. 427]
MSSIGKFIVVFKESATQEQINEYAEQVNSNGGKVTNHYGTVLKGFAAELTESQFQNFQGNDIIDYIEPDGVVTTQ